MGGLTHRTKTQCVMMMRLSLVFMVVLVFSHEACSRFFLIETADDADLVGPNEPVTFDLEDQEGARPRVFDLVPHDPRQTQTVKCYMDSRGKCRKPFGMSHKPGEKYKLD